MVKLVQGVGIKGNLPTVLNGKVSPEYRLWTNMLTRCYCPSYHKSRPTYKNCEVSERFKSFELFVEWCEGQIGYGESGFALDLHWIRTYLKRAIRFTMKTYVCLYQRRSTKHFVQEKQHEVIFL